MKKENIDFNDMGKEKGLVAVHKCIEKSLQAGVTSVTNVTPIQDKVIGVTSESMNDEPGVTSLSISEVDRPCFRNFLEQTSILESSAPLSAGVWFLSKRTNKEDDVRLIQQRVSSPISIDAVTFDDQEKNFGRLLRFQNTLGNEKTFAMPMELLAGSGDNIRAELLSMGVEIDPDSSKLLMKYLQVNVPSKKVHCATQVGWYKNNYVLPDEVIGPDSEAVIFQSGVSGHVEFTQKGSLEAWKNSISRLAIGNPLLTLSISAAFAGPLLKPCGAEGGGFHFYANSSTGKTTLMEVARSVWGGPAFKRSWRGTANGMEGAAVMFNDCLLALDEISECIQKELGSIIYSLGNGSGKQRASRSGRAKPISQWLCFVLSTGEKTIATTMSEAGEVIKAGQAIRLLDIPSSRSEGVFDYCHEVGNGANLSNVLKEAAQMNYGFAGRDFIRGMTLDDTNFSQALTDMKSKPEFEGNARNSQEMRAAERFASVALAGELATKYGLTGWPEGMAFQDAAELYNEWLSTRDECNSEQAQVVRQVRDFLDKYGDSLFTDIRHNVPVKDRAGYYKIASGIKYYLFTASGMGVAIKGHDLRQALTCLQNVGALAPTSDPKGARTKGIKIDRRTVRVYEIDPSKLDSNRED